MSDREVIEKLRCVVYSKLSCLAEDLWDGEDRDCDLYTCGAIDAEYDAWLLVAEILGMIDELNEKGYNTNEQCV